MMLVDIIDGIDPRCYIAILIRTSDLDLDLLFLVQVPPIPRLEYRIHEFGE